MEKDKLENHKKIINHTYIAIYDKNSNERWSYLYEYQLNNLKDKAYPDFLQYLMKLNIPNSYIPQIQEVSNFLMKKTGWQLEEVVGLVELEDFFGLLADRKFPCTNFIRTKQEIGISKDPDIFHELFGHVPMLIDRRHGIYLQKFGELGISLSKKEQLLFQRLFWFTYETGLLNTINGHRIFGGSLLSSIDESTHVFKNKVNKQTFNITEIFRTPYRDDQIQHIYYVMESLDELFYVLDNRDYLIKSIDEAFHMGEYHAPFIIEGNARHENVGRCKFIIPQQAK